LATLAQHINSTNATTPRKSTEVRLISGAIRLSRSGSTVTPRPVLVVGYSRAKLAAMVSRSLCAAAGVTPGFSRPTARMKCAARESIDGSSVQRVHMLLGVNTWKSAGTTPITVNGCWSSLMTWPTMAGSASNRLRQKPALSTTTLGGQAMSVERNVRPRIGRTPNTSKNSAVTCWAGIC
jgi:hypothetical protein